MALCVLALAAAVMATAPVAAASRSHRHAAGTHRESTRTSTTVPAPPVESGLGPPYTVRPEAITLNDPSRVTPARGSVPAAPGRLLVTDLYVPTGAAGPLPLVVFAHGWNSDPAVYAPLLQQWAEAGFLVAAPVFPDSTDLYAGTPVSDYADQALDISFVITSLLRGSAGVRVDRGPDCRRRALRRGHGRGAPGARPRIRGPKGARLRLHGR